MREGVTVDAEFVRRQIPAFLVVLNAQPYSRIMDDQYAKDVQMSKALGRDPKMQSEIVGLCYDPKVISDTSKWGIHFRVMNGDGSVSLWDVSGDMNPFSFKRIAIEHVRSRGSLKLIEDRY